MHLLVSNGVVEMVEVGFIHLSSVLSFAPHLKMAEDC